MGDLPVHKDICIKFTLGGQTFEAVGFLAANEQSIQGSEAIHRVGNGHIIRSDKDWQFVYDHRAELPLELGDYWLVTAHPNSAHPRAVSGLGAVGGTGDATGWSRSWGLVSRQWHQGALVLRRSV